MINLERRAFAPHVLYHSDNFYSSIRIYLSKGCDFLKNWTAIFVGRCSSYLIFVLLIDSLSFYYFLKLEQQLICPSLDSRLISTLRLCWPPWFTWHLDLSSEDLLSTLLASEVRMANPPECSADQWTKVSAFCISTPLIQLNFSMRWSSALWSCSWAVRTRVGTSSPLCLSSMLLALQLFNLYLVALDTPVSYFMQQGLGLSTMSTFSRNPLL